MNPLFTFRGKPSTTVEILCGAGFALALIGVWEAASDLGWIAPTFLPSPSRVAVAGWGLLTKQHLLWHAGVSTLRVWVAFLIAAAMALSLHDALPIWS